MQFYQKNVFFKENLQPTIMLQILQTGIVKPNLQKFAQGKTILNRAQRRLKFFEEGGDEWRKIGLDGRRLLAQQSQVTFSVRSPTGFHSKTSRTIVPPTSFFSLKPDTRRTRLLCLALQAQKKSRHVFDLVY